MLSEYRQHFEDFQSELQHEAYLFHSGHKPSLEIARIRREYSDLFKPSAMAELRAKLEDTSEQRETERTCLKRLIAFAVEGSLLARAQAVSDEIEDYETNALIDWAGQGQRGQKISFRSSASALSEESDFPRRRDLFARRAGALAAADDLRSERLEKLRDGAVELGYDNRLAMLRDLRGLDYV